MCIFYEIINEKGDKSYLFGTLHSNDKKILNLPIEVKEAFEKSNKFFFEIDTDDSSVSMANLLENWSSNDPSYSNDFNIYVQEIKLKMKNQLLKEMDIEQYSLIENQIEKNLTENLQFTPPIILAINILGNQGNKVNSYNEALDIQLLKQAKATKKPIFYFETLKEQAEIIYGLKQDFSEHLEFYRFVTNYLEQGGKKIIHFDEDFLKNQYLQNPSYFEIYNYPFANENPPETVKKYFENMLTRRELHMVNFLLPHLAMGDAFTAVGVLHLPRIISELKRHNYKVNPITVSDRTHPVSSLRVKKEKPESPSQFTQSLFFTTNYPISEAEDNLNLLKRAGFTDKIIKKIGLININALVIQPKSTLHEFLFDESGKLRFFASDLLDLNEEVKITAFGRILNFTLLLSKAPLSSIAKVQSDWLKKLLTINERTLELLLKYSSWEEITKLNVKSGDHHMDNVYLAHYTHSSLEHLKQLPSTIRDQLVKNCKGLVILFKDKFRYLEPTLNEVCSMDHYLREAFLSHPEQLKKLLELASKAKLSFKSLITLNSDLLISYLNDSPYGFLGSSKSNELIDLIKSKTPVEHRGYCI